MTPARISSFAPRGDGRAEVRDAVEIVHGAVERIDDPLELAVLIAADAFLAKDGVVGEAFQEHLGDEVLGFHVEGKLDVVRGELVHIRVLAKVFAQQPAGGERGGNGGVEVRGHGGKSREKMRNVAREIWATACGKGERGTLTRRRREHRGTPRWQIKRSEETLSAQSPRPPQG